MDEFKQSLKNTVYRNGLSASNWKSSFWKLLVNQLSQEILDDAYNKHIKLEEILRTVGTIIPRKCKTMSRIKKKFLEISVRNEEYFKVLSDFVACRIHCSVPEIPSKIFEIRKIVKKLKGIIYVRGEENSPYGFCLMGDKKEPFTDITQYCYIFLNEIEYPIEIQIGHIFSSHTFIVDSILRDKSDESVTDLWTDGFYNITKNYILNKANNIKTDDYDDIMSKAIKIHSGTHNIPKKLVKILNDLNN